MATNRPEALTAAFRWGDEKQVSIRGLVDQWALSGGKLAYCSVVLPLSQWKAMRTALNLAMDHPIDFEGFTCNPGGNVSRGPFVGSCKPAADGYLLWVHRIGCGTVHAVAVTRADGFMLSDDDDTLWAELNKDRFTTPLLRSWLHYIRDQCVINKWLHQCKSYRCECWKLSVTNEQLDSIVEKGLKTKMIKIG